MKKIFPILLLSFFCYCTVAAQTTAPEIKEQSVLVYKVKEAGKTYNYTVTIYSNESDEIDFEWSTDEKPARKGKVITDLDFSDANADELLITNFKTGTEELEATQLRLFLPQSIVEIISNAAMTSIDFNVNGMAKTVSMNYSNLSSNGKLLYNGNHINAEYSELINKTAGIVLGYIECDESDKHLVTFYKDKRTTMQLISIKTPAEEASSSLSTLAAFLKPEVPKKPELKKMDAAKFSIVKNKYPTLAKLEDFDPTNKGSIAKPFEETYEYRVKTNSANPPSLVDCFICDLNILYTRRERFTAYTGNIDEEFTSNKVPASLVAKLLQIYLHNDVTKTPGYRPWTHNQFVNSLSETERSKLSKEIEAYVKAYGILDVKW